MAVGLLGLVLVESPGAELALGQGEVEEGARLADREGAVALGRGAVAGKR